MSTTPTQPGAEMDDAPYNRKDLPDYLNAKLASAKELFEAGKISRSELFRCEVDRDLGRDTGPILMICFALSDAGDGSSGEGG